MTTSPDKAPEPATAGAQADSDEIFRLSPAILFEPIVTCFLTLCVSVALLRFGPIYLAQLGERTRFLGETFQAALAENGTLNLMIVQALAVLVALIVLYRVVSRFAQWLTSTLTISPGRIVWRSGFIRRAVSTVATRDVSAVRLVQSVLGRLLGYGRLVVVSRGDEAIDAWPLHGPFSAEQRIMALKSTFGRA